MALGQQGQNARTNAPQGATNNAFNLGAPVGKYASLGDLASVLAPDVRKDLVKTFGNQGISGLLELMGAVKAVGTNDEVTYFEETRLHPIQAVTLPAEVAAGKTQLIPDNAVINDGGNYADADILKVREGDLVIHPVDKIVCIVTAATASTGAFTIANFADANLTAIPAGAKEFPIIGNMYAQGTDQPGRFIESNIVKRTNPFAIVKETYQVSGSAATNIGYIDVGGGDYRWYIKGEMDARQRFLDARELTMLFGKKMANASGPSGIDGTEGYFSAIAERGITTATAGDLDNITELDTLIALLDKQGAAPEYAAMLNSAVFASFNNMPSRAGVDPSQSLTSGVAANFGAFQNNQDLAINLGFQSFARGGYTFHLKKMGLLNNPNLLGNAAGEGIVKGCLVPLTTVADPMTGHRAPALEMNYKAANGYNREMEHWVTGGGVLGFTNDTSDIAKFHYRSECCLITRAANQHVLIKG
tara:strand:+ start:11478 stop:12899 length:1422 start_codon:yes stop_codon:yes gene_type:complete